MAKSINQKCLECSKVSIRRVAKPKCYRIEVCARRRGYYRNIEYYRAKLRQYHRYLKFLGNKCLVCGSSINLEAHHIISQAMNGKDVENNIVTLCKQCHKVITIYNRRIGIERNLKD